MTADSPQWHPVPREPGDAVSAARNPSVLRHRGFETIQLDCGRGRLSLRGWLDGTHGEHVGG